MEQLTFPLPELTSAGAIEYPPPPNRRVYCNRSLQLDGIDWVGFDMDYTLAVYKQAEMDRVSISVTVDKLIEKGYPEELRNADYPTDFPIRGLLIDRKLGNILKMDRYKYVKMAYHGTRRLSLEERRTTYHQERLQTKSDRYHWVDTLYALSEVIVYSSVIDVLESLNKPCDFDQVFSDVRACIDLSHQDGSILDQITADLPRFVERDPSLPATLHKLRSAGKKLFVLTNSHPEYSYKMLEFLLDGARPEYTSWRNYFDLVMTASRKPKFFTDNPPFYEVTSGEHVEIDVPQPERGRVYFGGNIAALQKALNTSGDRVLYVGDHIYGDVLRAKKETAWRTVMIVQEMDAELKALQETLPSIAKSDDLQEARNVLFDQLRDYQERNRLLSKEIERHGGDQSQAQERTRVRQTIDQTKKRIRQIDEEHERLEDLVGSCFHKQWGSLFKAGLEVSSFGSQVEKYACLYTARVSNFLMYSPRHYFQSPRDRMPHEL